MDYSTERGDAVSAVSPLQCPEEKFVSEDLDVVRTYINLAFGVSESSARNVNEQDVSAKGGSVKESSAGGTSATCIVTTPWLLLQ